MPLETRVVPDTWDERQREQFLQIAARSKNEICASYAVVSLGLQAYARNRAPPPAAADRP